MDLPFLVVVQRLKVRLLEGREAEVQLGLLRVDAVPPGDGVQVFVSLVKHDSG